MSEKSFSWGGWWRQCWWGILLALVIGVAVGYSAFKSLTIEGNNCGWPDKQCEQIEGSPAARVILDGVMARANEALEKGHIDVGTRNEIAHWVERAKDGELRNDAGTHVCQVTGPTACEDLADIGGRVLEASQAATPREAGPLWQKALDGLRDFPSGQ